MSQPTHKSVEMFTLKDEMWAQSQRRRRSLVILTDLSFS